MGGELFLGGGEGDDVFVDWVWKGRGENWMREVV